MAVFFLDTSAFVKRYLTETGSAWVRDLARPSAGHRVYVAWIAGPEVVSALTRRERGGELARDELVVLLGQFRREWEGRYHRLDMNAPVLRRAMDLAEHHGLRGYDSVQLAAAIESAGVEASQNQSVTFVSADADLNAAASAEGLAVENPNDHP